ncbi:MAG: YgiQ family radical SAM protein, partial [Bacteroidales bacterium]|nr:YgiQ family radical SAM protein [Bacteroidales bacterium]
MLQPIDPDRIPLEAWLPVSKKEMEKRGWEQADIILLSGDAYVDHPSFGVAVIGRVLEKAGFKVAVLPQPNWKDDLRDFKKLGKPRLFFGVSAGSMDSMVNHYTARKRLRSNDAYTPGGAAGFRPDYPTLVYTRILKQIFPDVPVILGGIEASLRRITHYDYWQDKLLPSFVKESGADLLVYGMGEKPMVEIARRLDRNINIKNCEDIPQVSYFCPVPPEKVPATPFSQPDIK